MDYDTAAAALETLRENDAILTDQEFEALESMVGLFAPYDGDPAHEAKARSSSTMVCQNCDYRTPMLFFPAELSRTASSALRHCSCPRCFSTNTTLDQSKESTNES